MWNENRNEETQTDQRREMKARKSANQPVNEKRTAHPIVDLQKKNNNRKTAHRRGRH